MARVVELPSADLDHILSLTESLWGEFREKRIFVTGGTGFVGSWLLQSFLHANRRFSLGAEMVVLSRNPSAYFDKNPNLKSDSALRFVCGDVRSFDYPEGDFDFVIHGATEPAGFVEFEKARQGLDICYKGTERVLEFCKSKNVKKYLYVSSGAAYGQQPAGMSQLEEGFLGSSDLQKTSAAYGEGKRISEWLSIHYGIEHHFDVTIARCFSFVGPGIPLSGSYAIGNFIRDVLSKKNIIIRGDGLAKRSYMYGSDLAIWLWHILVRGSASQIYNVGSDQEISIKGLAEKIVSIGRQKLEILVQGAQKSGLSGDVYVPSTKKAQQDMGLCLTVDLDSAIQKTFDFYSELEGEQ